MPNAPQCLFGTSLSCLHACPTTINCTHTLTHRTPMPPLLNPHAVTFFTYFGDEYSLAANLDWNLTCFVVILPLLGFVWVSYGRRERALDELSRGAWARVWCVC